MNNLVEPFFKGQSGKFSAIHNIGEDDGEGR